MWSVADLPAKRIDWITRNYEANLAFLMTKINDVEGIGDGLGGEIAYLQLLREISVVIAQLDLLKKGDVLLVSSLPPSRPGHLRLQEFSFVNNTAVTLNRDTAPEARLVYDIDLASHSDISELDNRIAALKQASAVENAYKFNSLNDETRAQRVSDFKERWKDHMAAREALSALDKSSPDYLERLKELWQQSQAARADCELLIPASIAVDAKSGIARSAK